VGERTTTSDYFAASGKSKPTRSTPTKSKAQSGKTMSHTPHASARSTLKVVISPRSGPATNGKVSSRKKIKPIYRENDDDEGEDHDGFKPNFIEDCEGSGEDVFEADYKSSRPSGKDAYESEDDDDVAKQRNQKSLRGGWSRPSTKKAQASKDDDDDDDIQIQEIKMKDIPEYNELKAGSLTNDVWGPKSRKRKSTELDEEDEDEEDFVEPASKKAKALKRKPSAKGSLKKTKEDEPKIRAAVDDILESIPTVKAPTPPPRDDSKKNDWRGAAGRGAAPSASSAHKELPNGAKNCLAGLTFVFTGILHTLDRTVSHELVKQHGGKVTSAPSKKTSYVVLGVDAGPKKLETINQYGLTAIDENGLFELIRRMPANGGDSKAAEQFEEKARKEAEQVEKAARAMMKQEHEEAKKFEKAASSASQSASKTGGGGPLTKDNRLWTVKYAPTATNMICGNKGQVEKLQAWLRAWPANLKVHFKKGGKDGHGAFRAMCLHGPPGIGKTAAAHLAAKLENYDIVESNASDTRSKKLVETGLKGVLDTTSLLGYFAGDGKKVEAEKKRLVLIMDEVDGMSAGDRGGVGALAATCKKTNIPIILICNDRKLPKMKPFDSVAYDLPFRRPTVDQIRQRIMTICFREKLSIPATVINALIEGTHADIRQVINMLSAAKLDEDNMDFDKGTKMTKSWEKNIILRPWDIVSKILGGGMFASSSTSTLNDKIELYFNDHEFSSLMLQENYLGTRPMLANPYSGKEYNLKALELSEQAAASISDGDLIDRMIHGSQQQWALMPTHAVFSFVRPASFVSGSQAGSQTRFTQWLGNNSKQSKHNLKMMYRYMLMLWCRQAHTLCQRDSRPHAASFVWRPSRDQTAVPSPPLVSSCQGAPERWQGWHTKYH